MEIFVWNRYYFIAIIMANTQMWSAFNQTLSPTNIQGIPHPPPPPTTKKKSLAFCLALKGKMAFVSAAG